MRFKNFLKIICFGASLVSCLFYSGMVIAAQTDTAAKNTEVPQTSFTGTINADSVNIRSGPSINFEIINKLDKNDIVLVEGQEQDWYKIRIPRHSSIYIYKKYVSPAKACGLIGLIVADRVTLRAGNGTNFNSLGQLNHNDKVEILSREGEWYKVFLYNDIPVYAWVNKNFVSNHDPAQIYLEKTKAYEESLNLLEQAEDTERDALKEKHEKADINLIVEAYKTIIDKYPDTQASKIAKKRISKLGKKLPAIKKQPAEETTNQQEEQKQPNAETITPVTSEIPLAEGKIMDIGHTLNRTGTHKLVKGNETIYFLKSDKINLNSYIYLNVAIWGKEIKTTGKKIPLIEVEAIKKLQ